MPFDITGNGFGRSCCRMDVARDILRSFRVVAVGAGNTGGILLFLPALEDVSPGAGASIAGLPKREAAGELGRDISSRRHRLLAAPYTRLSKSG